MPVYEQHFLRALPLTVAVEACVVIALLRLLPALKKYPLSLLNVAAAGTVPSILTLPYLWFIMPLFIQNYTGRVVGGEITVFLAETVLLRVITGIPWRCNALLSFVANGASILAGLIVFR